MTRLAVVALVCTLALPARAEPDAGVREHVVLDVEYADLKIADAGVVHVLGGFWLDTPTGIDLAQNKVAVKAEDASLKSSAVPPPGWLIGVIAGALLLGAAAGALSVTLINPSVSLPH